MRSKRARLRSVWVIVYAAGVLIVAILVFQKKMHADQA